MFFKFICSIGICLLFQVNLKAQSKYSKTRANNNALQSEGWLKNNKKTAYWYFYHSNGKIAKKGPYQEGKKHGYWYFYNQTGVLIKEGHFKNDRAENWWISYGTTKGMFKKNQYKDDQKNGFCLIYERNKLFKAERYVGNKKTGEWRTLRNFIRDNPEASF